MARHLQLVHSRADLPVSWDGEPVTWSAWDRGRTTLALHLPVEQLACDQCGALDERDTCAGTRTTEVPAHSSRDLHAFRCRHCGHDTVLDLRTNECWDLDPEDYTPDGSRPSTTLF